MTRYALQPSQHDLFEGADVLELGGGQTCLAGLAVARLDTLEINLKDERQNTNKIKFW